MDDDVLDEFPGGTRAETVAAVRAAWELDSDAAAEDILRASEPFWNVLESHGGVDSWGGGEFRHAFPQMLVALRRLCT